MVVEKGYKQTEIGVIPEDWEVKKFKDISYMKGRIGWQGLKQTEFTDNPEEPFLITGMNFKDGAIRWNEVYHISEARFNIAKEIQLKSDDVLMTKDGTIGKLLFVDDLPYPHKATLNSHLLLFRPLKNSYHPKYLYYNLGSPFFFKHIEVTKSGTTFFGISQESVGEYNIILPPLPEQTAIANALSDMDALIAQTEKLIEKKKAIKQGVMQELLTGKNRLGEFDNKKGYKKTELGFIPEDWEVKYLGDLGEVRMCKRIFNHQTKEVGDIPFFKIGTFGKEPDAYICKELYNNYKHRFPFPIKGTLLISAAGTIGRTIIYDGKPAYFQDSNIVWIDNDEKIISNVLLFQILQIVNYNTEGGTIQRLYNNILKSTKFICPPPPEQNLIAKVLMDLDTELERIETKLQKLKHQKQGMMQALLTGKIRLI